MLATGFPRMFTESLEKEGIFSDDDVSLLNYLGYDSVFRTPFGPDPMVMVDKPEVKGTSDLRRRAAFNVLINGVDPRETPKPYVQQFEVVSADRPIGQWKDTELLAEYGKECSQDVVDELDRRAHGMPFVLFTDSLGAAIDAERTIGFLRSARRNIAPPSNFKVGKQVLRTYRAGEFPAQFLELCPLHSSVTLYEGYCDQCKQDWSEIGMKEQQFISLLPSFSYGFKKKSEYDELFTLAKGGVEALGEEYPDVMEKFERLEEAGTLPILVVRPSHGGKKADPVNVKTSGNRRF
jgi:hypothetical protein